MKKYCLDISFSILIFLFSIFALTNIGFLLNLSINPLYVFISLILALFYLYKSKNFIKKSLIFFIILFLSFIFACFFIDTSFDGRCYHFTTEYLLKLGYNPIYQDIFEFASKNNVFYNLLFSNSYPNGLEVIRANFYKLFNYMEITKCTNFLFGFFGFFYSFYFFNNKINSKKAFLLSICVIFVQFQFVKCRQKWQILGYIIYF